MPFTLPFGWIWVSVEIQSAYQLRQALTDHLVDWSGPSADFNMTLSFGP